jgi:pimeloyl-ACP methyl ester carboxylesterase
MKTILVAIHGILTSQTDPSWPDRLDAWMYRRDPTVKVLKKEYRAGPFPRWNCWFKDPLLGRGLANEVELFLPSDKPAPALWFVAHSNGAVIALLAAKRLIESGHNVSGMILTGAACEGDIDKNHVDQWLRERRLGSAMAYSSAEDRVLPQPATSSRSVIRAIYSVLARPYGSLGSTGWLRNGEPLSDIDRPFATLQTRWFAGGHSIYFMPAHIERTFEQIYQDIALSLQPDISQ